MRPALRRRGVRRSYANRDYRGTEALGTSFCAGGHAEKLAGYARIDSVRCDGEPMHGEPVGAESQTAAISLLI